AGGRGDPLAAARALAAEEVRRLRPGPGSTPAGAGELQRRAALADLASRLVALLQHVGGQADEMVLAPLRSLAAALAACDGPNPPRGADLDALWQRAIDVLSAFAGGPPAGQPPDTQAPGTQAPGAQAP